MQTRNSSIPTSSVNIQLKHSIQTFNLVPKLRREDEAKCERALIDMDSEVRMLR